MEDFKLAKKKTSDTKQDNTPRSKQYQLQLCQENVVADHKEEDSDCEPFCLETVFITIK